MSTPLQARLARKTLEILNEIEKKLPNIKDNLKIGLKTAIGYADKVKKRVQGTVSDVRNTVSDIEPGDTKQNILNKIDDIRKFIRNEITRFPEQNKDFDSVLKALDKIVEKLSSNQKSGRPGKKIHNAVTQKTAENTSKTRGRKKKNTDNTDKNVATNTKKRPGRKKKNTDNNNNLNENQTLPLENTN